jgi:recombination protein RecA
VAPPFRDAEFDIMYGTGISREGELLDLAVQHNVVEKSGSWFSFGGERLGQGRENAKQFLRENTALSLQIEESVRRALGLEVAGTSASGKETEREAAAANGKR